jgi:hypothetical protein
MTNRPARAAAALATALLVGGIAPLAVASPATSLGASGASHAKQADQADRARGKQWQLIAALGKGPRKLTFSACTSGVAPGSLDLHYKAATRRSSDHRYPRYEFKIVDGGSTGEAEDALFPGDLVYVSTTGTWTVNAQVHLVLHNQGKVKKKDFTLGQVLPC